MLDPKKKQLAELMIEDLVQMTNENRLPGLILVTQEVYDTWLHMDRKAAISINQLDTTKIEIFETLGELKDRRDELIDEKECQFRVYCF